MIKVSDELIYDWTVGEALLKRLWQEYSQRVEEQAFMDIDEAIMGPETSVKARFLELLEQHPELTRPQAYMQAVMEMSEPIVMKATIGNFDEYRYCTMKVEGSND